MICNPCSLGAAKVIVWGATNYTHNDKYVCVVTAPPTNHFLISLLVLSLPNP